MITLIGFSSLDGGGKPVFGAAAGLVSTGAAEAGVVATGADDKELDVGAAAAGLVSTGPAEAGAAGAAGADDKELDVGAAAAGAAATGLLPVDAEAVEPLFAVTGTDDNVVDAFVVAGVVVAAGGLVTACIVFVSVAVGGVVGLPANVVVAAEGCVGELVIVAGAGGSATTG